MAIPSYEKIMHPLLNMIKDGKEYRVRDLVPKLANEMSLTADERNTMAKSGSQTIFSNRVAWARTYVKKAGLLDSPQKGYVQITPLGQSVLKENPESIDNKFLKKYPSFVEFTTTKKKPNTEADTEPIDNIGGTPEEVVESAMLEIRCKLADDLLDQILSCSPQFFEHLVVELLVSMGYGGSIEDAGQAVGRSGDEGIDGIIKEDKLGLDVVCIQAKRYKKGNTVGRPTVQAFAGSMEGYRAKKGVLITTSVFSKEAYEYIRKIERKIVLIDGARLAELMIDNNVGVSLTQSYEIKRIDNDYFEGS